MTILSLLWSGLAVFVASYILPGVHIADFTAGLVATILLAVVNTIIRPIILLLTLPINILTLGLLTFAINGLLVLLVAKIVPGFTVDSFWWAVAFSIIMSLVNILSHSWFW